MKTKVVAAWAIISLLSNRQGISHTSKEVRFFDTRQEAKDFLAEKKGYIVEGRDEVEISTDTELKYTSQNRMIGYTDYYNHHHRLVHLSTAEALNLAFNMAKGSV